jgi:tetratricopeptide (TPR) repeat protein
MSGAQLRFNTILGTSETKTMMESLKALAHWAVSMTDQWSPEMKAVTAIGSAVGAIGTITATVYKLVRWVAGRQDRDTRTSAKAMIEALQKAGLAPTDMTLQIERLEAAISDLKAARAEAAKQQKSKYDEALALLEQGNAELAEALLTGVAIEEETKGGQANRRAARAYRNVGALAFLTDTQKAFTAYSKAVSLDPNEPSAWHQLGMLLSRVGRHAEAEVAFRNALSIADRVGDEKEQAAAHLCLGAYYRQQGRLEEAKREILNAVKIYEKLNQQRSVAGAYVILGAVYQKDGKLDLAEGALAQATKIFEASGEKGQAAGASIIAAGNYLMRGDLPNAERLATNALKVFRELNSKGSMASAYGVLAQIFMNNDTARAEQMALQSLNIYHELNQKEGVASALGTLGMIYEKCGDLPKAKKAILEAARIYESANMRYETAAMYNLVAELAYQQGHTPGACENWKKACDIYRAIGKGSMADHIEAHRREVGCSDV